MEDTTTPSKHDPKLSEIESRQDRLLQELDQLNQRIESALSTLIPARGV